MQERGYSRRVKKKDDDEGGFHGSDVSGSFVPILIVGLLVSSTWLTSHSREETSRKQRFCDHNGRNSPRYLAPVIRTKSTFRTILMSLTRQINAGSKRTGPRRKDFCNYYVVLLEINTIKIEDRAYLFSFILHHLEK